MRTIDNVHDAFWFLYEHPKSVEESPDCPFVVRTTKNRSTLDKEYRHAASRKAIRNWWRGQFIHQMDIYCTKVNPVTERVDEDVSLNTKIEIWLETGSAEYSQQLGEYIGNTHDPSLDCGGATYEEALIKMARNVLDKYGDYTEEEAL